MRRRVWAAIILASLGWGTGGVGTRAAFETGMGPYAVVALRTLVATVAVLVYLVARTGRIPRQPLVWRVGAVQGLANLALPYLLFTLAYQHASAGFVGLIAALIPIATAILAHFTVTGETLTILKFAGLGLAFSGVGVLGLAGDSGLEQGGRPGLALVLGVVSVALITVAGVYAKRHAADYDAIELTWVQFVVGSGLIVIAMVVLEGWPHGVTGEGWALVTYLGLASSFLPFALFFWMLRHTTITQASLVGYLVPIISVAAGVLLLDERLQPGIVIGGILILGGVIVADRVESKAALRPPEPAVVPAGDG